jgi:hypothetical protein
MLRRFLKKLPTSLTSLDLSISADALEKVPELPPNLTSLRYCEGVAPATHTPRFWLKLPETHRPDLSSLPNFQWDYYSRKISVAADKFASEIGLFNNIRSLDISNVQLRSVADLKLIPRYLTHLKFNFHHSYRRGTLSMSDVSILPRTITHLTLLQCPWVNSKNSNENANNFCSLLPPNLTYFYLGDLNGLWNFSIAFSEMRSSLKHLQTLIIDTPLLELHTFDPWLPCDTLHTLEILANEGCLYVHRDLFSSWPTEIPNNIKRLKFSLSYYGGDAEPYEDDNLQKLPPHLTSLTLDGRCFRISPSFFGSLPKSVTFLELSTSFTHQEEEEEFYYDDCLKDTVIVRHCPQHIELHMNYIFTGAFLPSNLTKLTTDHGPILEVIPRPQLPSQLRYCNLSYVKLDSNCIIPDTLTELDFGSDPIDLALVSKSPNLQRLTGYATDPMDLSNFTSLKSLRLFSLDEYFGPPDEGNQNTSLQELVLQSAWTQEASTYKLSQFPNITSLKIVDHHNYDGGKSHLLFPTVPNKKKKNKKKKKTTTTTTDGLDTGGRTSQLPVLSKLQHLEARGDLIIITQSQLKHVTPNLTFLTIGSVSIDNLKEILKSLTPDITELTSEIEIIKAICPSITALGTPPPKILFSGQDISFPVDCKALLSQLDETLKEAEAEDHAYGVWHKGRKRDSLM